jgi:hypothetical protein
VNRSHDAHRSTEARMSPSRAVPTTNRLGRSQHSCGTASKPVFQGSPYKTRNGIDPLPASRWDSCRLGGTGGRYDPGRLRQRTPNFTSWCCPGT